MSDPLLRALVDLRDRQIQKSRIQFNNRLAALNNASDESAGSGQRQVVERWLDVFTALEKQIDKDIAAAVKNEPIYGELSNIRGIGPMLAAKLIAMIDIDRDDTVSALWRYSGYGMSFYWQADDKIVAPKSGWKWTGPKDNRQKIFHSPQPEPGWTLVEVRDRPIEGYLLPYNKRLKSTLFVIAGSFLKSGSPYRQFYDSAKAHYEATTDWTKKHIHQAAMRRMVKLFLSHLWQRWRELEGLPIRAAYANNHLGHETVITPQEFGWGPCKLPKSKELGL